MNKDLIMESDVLDILFENKNKAYGAYTLRKFYNKRLRIALAIMFLITGILYAFTLIPAERNLLSFVEIPEMETGKVGIKPELKKPDLPKPKLLKAVPVIPAEKFIANIKIVKRNDDADKLPDNLDNSTIATTVIPGTPYDGGSGKTVDSSKISGEVDKHFIDANVPVYEVDDKAEFPGGMKALRDFLKKNLVNPKEMEEGEEVNVKIKFVVGYDGKLKSFEIMESGGDEFNEEVIRVLKKMPTWTPGKIKGKNVSVYTAFPVKFVGAH